MWLGGFRLGRELNPKCVTRNQFHKITISLVFIFIHSFSQSVSPLIGPGAGGTEINKTLSLSSKSLLSAVERVKGMCSQIKGWNTGNIKKGWSVLAGSPTTPSAGPDTWGKGQFRLRRMHVQRQRQGSHMSHLEGYKTLPTSWDSEWRNSWNNEVAKWRKMPLRIWGF